MASLIINLISFLILCVFFYGRSLRHKNPKKHAKTMSMVICADLILILFLVIGRSALSKVSLSMPIYLIVHISFALSTVIFYVFAIIYGVKILKGQRQYISKMKLIDRFVTPLRVLTLITSILLMVLR
ncbi:MAG: hypothetical protein KDD34_05805 [Bdellovibrionales bacterium]|nr:hypothetical protein [Bdellovibrionales bacterium]MCB0407701.1 hypothetical protein [Bdellovibrionales bacterium]